MKHRLFWLLGAAFLTFQPVMAADNKGIAFPELSDERFTLIENGNPVMPIKPLE